jgi:hypothetical protein
VRVNQARVIGENGSSGSSSASDVVVAFARFAVAIGTRYETGMTTCTRVWALSHPPDDFVTKLAFEPVYFRIALLAFSAAAFALSFA